MPGPGVFFLPCGKCGRRGRICSLTLIRFKTWCEQCGHSAACHESRKVYTLSTIMLVITVLLIGSLALFGNLR